MKNLRTAIYSAFLAVAALMLVDLGASAFTYSTAVKNSRMTAVRDAWGASAKMKIWDGGDGGILCATFTLSATTADSTIAAGVLTIKFTGNSASQTVVAGNTCGSADTATITTSADVNVVNGLTVGTSGSDINLNTTNIGAGANVTISAASLTHS